MRMTTALHLVPEPDDEGTPPHEAAGEHPGLAPAPAIEQDSAEGLHDAREADADADVEGDEDDVEEELAPQRAMALPDLRPYADVAAVPQLIAAGVSAARQAQAVRRKKGKDAKGNRRPYRFLANAVDVAAGSLAMLKYCRAWLYGECGSKNLTGGGRLLTAFVVGYVTFRTATTWPVWGPVGIGGAWTATAFVTAHRQRSSASKAKGAAGDSPEPAEQAPAGRWRWDRLTSRRRTADTPAPTSPAALGEGLAEGADRGPAEGEEEAPGEGRVEPPALPSPEVLTGAVHHLYSGASGVLLTALRQHLSLPHTRAVREALDGAGIRVREGVRTPAGTGPGVHIHDFPPPPPSPGPTPESVVGAGQSANNNIANTGSEPKKGLRADGSYWPPGKSYHFEPHPDNPDRTVIVHHGDPIKTEEHR